MRVPSDIHVHVHLDVDPDPRIDRILTMLANITTQGATIMSDQSHADDDAAKIQAQNQQILDAVNAIKSQPAAAGVDFTALDAAVAGEAADVTAVQGLPGGQPPVTPPTA